MNKMTEILIAKFEPTACERKSVRPDGQAQKAEIQTRKHCAGEAAQAEWDD